VVKDEDLEEETGLTNALASRFSSLVEEFMARGLSWFQICDVMMRIIICATKRYHLFQGEKPTDWQPFLLDWLVDNIMSYQDWVDKKEKEKMTE
jgi:hypothetical protein